MKRTAFITLIALGALSTLACGKILGLGDPKAYPPDSGVAIDTTGKVPVTTEDAAACGNANLVTDGNNCGRCGHSCLGGTCERARCVPIGVTPADTEVFAVNGGRVFSFTQAQIIRTDANGAHFLIADTTQAGHPRAMLATSLHLVWSSDDVGTRLCSGNAGCGTDGLVQLSAAGKSTGPIGEVADIDPLYPYLWANYTDSTVEKYTAGAAPTVLATDTHLETATCAPSFAGAYLMDQPAAKITLFHAAPPPVDTAGAPDECAIAANSTNVFYTDSTNVWRTTINPDGTLSQRQPVATGLSAPKVIAADNVNVYWSPTTPETAIVRCPVTGCQGEPEVLADELPAIKALVVDDNWLYFAVYLDEAFQTQIYKVAK